MAKQERPFSDDSFDVLMDAAPLKGAQRTPQCGFRPSGKDKIEFFMYCNHPEMKSREGGQAKSWSQRMKYREFSSLVALINRVAKLPFDVNDPQSAKIEVPFKFYKGGERKFGGTTMTVGRDNKGRVYFTFSNNRIPRVGFFISSDTVKDARQDGEAVDPHFASCWAVDEFVAYYRARFQEWMGAYMKAEREESGGWQGGQQGGGNYGGGSGGGQSSFNDDGGDDDIPF